MTTDIQAKALAKAQARQEAAADAAAKAQRPLQATDQTRLTALAADAESLTRAVGLLAVEAKSAAGAQVAMRALAAARQLQAMLSISITDGASA